MERVIAYVDGFNLYFGLKDKGWKRLYWLNVQLLVQNLLKPYQNLIKTKYFTTRITYPPDKQKRQSTFIEALETLPDFELFYGTYQRNTYECPNCHFGFKVPNEKKTDVNIAVEMVTDAYEDRFDVALLMSGDGDLIPAVETVKGLPRKRRIVIAFPPKRRLDDLARLADAEFVIGRRVFAKSIFPDHVTRQDGFVLERPEKWK